MCQLSNNVWYSAQIINVQPSASLDHLPEDVVRLGGGKSEDADQLEARATVEHLVLCPHYLSKRSWNTNQVIAV